MNRSKSEAALSESDIRGRLAALPGWSYEDGVLVREHAFATYKEALDFVYAAGLAAEENDHHPDIVMNFKRVTVRYWTHSAGGVTALDVRMAGIVEALIERHSRGRPVADA